MTHDIRLTVGQPVFIERTTSTFFSGRRLPPDSVGVRTQFSELRGYHQGKISDWAVVPYRAWTVSLHLFPVVGGHYIVTVMTPFHLTSV